MPRRHAVQDLKTAQFNGLTALRHLAPEASTVPVRSWINDHAFLNGGLMRCFAEVNGKCPPEGGVPVKDQFRAQLEDAAVGVTRT